MVYRSFFLLFALLLPSHLCGWGKEGHRLTARIAAFHLNDAARQRVFEILVTDPAAGRLLAGRSPHDAQALSNAMAEVSTWADVVKRQTIGLHTSSWHFIDLAETDKLSDFSARCGGPDCLTARLVTLRGNLHDGTPVLGHLSYGAVEELKFLIHFYGDLHQPLHDATNADAGGNCVKTTGFGQTELHAVLDDGLVDAIMHDQHGHPISEVETAHELNALHGTKFANWAATADVQQIALESHEIAFQKLYKPIFLSGQFFETAAVAFKQVSASCTGADPQLRSMEPLDIASIFGQEQVTTIGEQIAKGGFRLANALNLLFAH